MRRNKSRMLRRAVMISLFILCAFLFFGCGSASDSSPINNDIAPAQDIGDLTTLEKLIYTESYSGYLVVHLSKIDDVEASKLSISVYPAPIKAVDQIRPVIDAHPTVALKRSITLPEEEATTRRLYLERLSGKNLTDFNLIYHVEVSDPDEAVRVMRELQKTTGVEKVYPKRKAYVTGLSTVPDLTGHQGYLYPNETHGGLNAQAAWNAGAKGAGVVVLDSEFEWNFLHEDLPLQWGVDNWVAVSCYPTPVDGCLATMAHGTAVAGIIASLENGHGTTGFAPQADLKADGPDPEGYPIYLDGVGSLDDYMYREVPPGTIFVIETEQPGILSPTGFCSGFTDADQYGCVPLETDPENFAAIEYTTAAGGIVIDAAGNGSVDLGAPATYWPQEIHLYEHDSGSILVGGSQGSNHQKISFSNCGSPVDTYAWAQGVVTTAYPYGGSTGPYYWTPTGTNDPPNDDDNAYYTNRFGGTSSAAAMVAGAAVLVQSYTKNLMGQYRFLMSLKMRDILTSTGVAQSGGGCNIGKQPRIDQAIVAVNTFWNGISSSYPKLVSGGRLTINEMIAIRTLGLGLICKDSDPANSDPACPDDAMWVPGTRIAKSLDFDGDGKADLVSWTNGQWKIDLSSVGSGGDNFGSWDLILNYSPIQSKWVWPYVEDFNSDGREDLAVYDKEHGIWYITFTSGDLLSGIWHGWDWSIDYSAVWKDDLKMNPRYSSYSRPLPGDYNGDGLVDIAIACSDGYWRIDFGGPNRSNYGTFDRSVQYLDQQRLQDAPGWAYPIVRGKSDSDHPVMRIAYKVPDGLGLPDEGRAVIYYLETDGTLIDISSYMKNIFGGNHYVTFIHDYSEGISTKNSGTWEISRDGLTLDPFPPDGIWGKMECRPVVADFDGDLIDDRAVMCPDEWRIAYSTDPNNVRHIALGYDVSEWTIPGRTYSGGIDYPFVQQLIAYAQETNPNEPPPIPVDMVSVNVCSLPISSSQDACN